MTDASRTAARDLLTRAAEAGVAPMLLTGSPWAIRQDVLAQVAAAMRHQADGLAALRSLAPSPDRPPTAGVMTIPLAGIITPQGSFLDVLFGGEGGGLLAFREAFRVAMAAPEVVAIVIDVDSPGGMIDQVPETAAEIRAARGAGKPIIAIANTQMASAAYWIASQADQVVITPSGNAGSIGVYRVHEDWSDANTQAGVAITYVSAGKFKIEGNPNEPLGRTAKAQWQADVQDIYDMFVADVAAGRGVSVAEVIGGYGEGRSLPAARALAAGLVDRIATYDEVRTGIALGFASPASGVRVTAPTSSAPKASDDTAPVGDAEPPSAPVPAAPEPEPEPEPAAQDEDEPEAEAEQDDLSDDERAEIAAVLLA